MRIILEAILFLLFLIPLYFFIVTRGSLFIQSLRDPHNRSSHIYWIYSKKTLIWLTDRKFIISAILLFNYRRLVDEVLCCLDPSIDKKNVLQISCAFGDISQRLAKKSLDNKVKRLVYVDLIENELKHTRAKLRAAGLDQKSIYILGDAMSLPHADNAFDYVVIFFLFHELPMKKKIDALKEASRVLKPSGKIIIGEFHRPKSKILRYSGRAFFRVFEKYAHEMWGEFDPKAVLESEVPGKWLFTNKEFFLGNYMVLSAKKPAS